ncbi:MAG: anti-sigma factor family protein [Candidatus Promineifilaceae bacterium]
MFDFLRDLRKSNEEKRQEALTAYLDGALTPAERKRFERLLASDKALRASLEEQRLIKASLRRLPRMRAPRNFTLDPARYGRPAPSTPDRLYPIMRVATVVVAILFVLVLVIDLAPFAGGREASQSMADSAQPAAEVVQAPAAPEEEPVLEAEAQAVAVDEVVIEVTRVVTDEEAMAAMAAEEPAAAEQPAAEQPAAEEATEIVGEEVAEEAAEAEAPLAGSEQASGGGGLPPTETPLAMIAPATAEGAAAAVEGQAVEDRAIAGSPQPSEATSEAEALAATSETAQTKEAASQPTPSLAPRVIPSPAAESTAADQGPAQVTAGAGISTIQILAIGLGLLLVLLIAATLLLRRRTR